MSKVAKKSGTKATKTTARETATIADDAGWVSLERRAVMQALAIVSADSSPLMVAATMLDHTADELSMLSATVISEMFGQNEITQLDVANALFRIGERARAASKIAIALHVNEGGSQ